MTMPPSIRLKRCAVCRKWKLGTDPQVTYVSCTDLDGRPVGMGQVHLPLSAAIERCSRCGYCAPDISEKLSTGIEVVASDEYQNLLKDKNIPKLAREFLCWGMLQQTKNDPSGVWNAYLYAAWACDDAFADEGSKQYRERAIAILQDPDLTDLRLFPGGGSMAFVEEWTDEAILDSLHSGKLYLQDENLTPIDSATWDDKTIIKALRDEKAWAFETYLATDIGTRELVLADLLRRTEKFDCVEDICQRGVAKQPSDRLTKLLAFEQQLASQGDSGRYTVTEAEGTAQPYQEMMGLVGCGVTILFAVAWILILSNSMNLFFPDPENVGAVLLSGGVLIGLVILSVLAWSMTLKLLNRFESFLEKRKMRAQK